MSIVPTHHEAKIITIGTYAEIFIMDIQSSQNDREYMYTWLLISHTNGHIYRTELRFSGDLKEN